MRSAGLIPVNVRPGARARTTSTFRTCTLIRSKLRAGIFGDNSSMAMVKPIMEPEAARTFTQGAKARQAPWAGETWGRKP
jgi:hypothetical protein